MDRRRSEGEPGLGGGVDVWQVGLDPPGPALATREAVLSADERERVARFRFPRHRRRFAAGRGALRLLLARYLDADPAGLAFDYGAAGKPALQHQRLRFNVSHTGDLALIAIVAGREVGVDVERVRPASDLEQIARRFFSPAETARLLALPESDRPGAFCECWTRKEAWLKAHGAGLGLPLDGFEVAFGPGQPARLLAVRWDPAEVGRWSLADLEQPAGTKAALAIEGPLPDVRRFELDGLS